MVSKKEIKRQLKIIGFKYNGWGRAEVSELPHIILPGEEIYECVNGYYEGGFALLVATDVRVLLVDKKPLNYLTVEDMRFDMISEMDYSHRLIGADINISSGGKSLHFRSYNQPRLRKLIGHVQHCMAESKKKETTHQDSQVSHLEQINTQLQTYLVAQQQYQLQLQQLSTDKQSSEDTNTLVLTPPKPSNELADYLYSQSILNQYQQSHDVQLSADPNESISTIPQPAPSQSKVETTQAFAGQPNGYDPQIKDIYNEGFKEVFGSPSSNPQGQSTANTRPIVNTESQVSVDAIRSGVAQKISLHKLFSFDINPVHIALSRLPILLRNRKFRQVSLHHSHGKPPKINPSRA